MPSALWDDCLTPPAYAWVPPMDGTVGPSAARFCASVGFVPDTEQSALLDVVFGVRDGHPAAFETVVVAPRQNLKSAFFEMCSLVWLFVVGTPKVTWSAHEAPTVQGSYEHLLGIIEANPALDRRVVQKSGAPGAQRIKVRHDDGRTSLLQFRTRTNEGMRGLASPKLILDEAFALTPSQIGSVLPLMSAAGPNAQVLIGSSSGKPSSGVLRGWRDRGRAGDQQRMAYAEWSNTLRPACASPDCSHAVGVQGCRCDDPEVLMSVNSAVRHGRMSLEYLLNTERGGMPPQEFLRERLGEWEDPGIEESVVSPVRWAELADPDSEIVGEVVLALDVSPSRSWASIAAAGMSQLGRVHVELTGRTDADGLRLLDSRPGVEWLVERAAGIAQGLEEQGFRPRLLLLSGAAAESLGPALDRAGVLVELVSKRDFAAACGGLIDLIASGELVHIDQPELNTSVQSLVAQPAFESMVTWARKKSTADITAAVAATVAAWGAGQVPQVSAYDGRGVEVI